MMIMMMKKLAKRLEDLDGRIQEELEHPTWKGKKIVSVKEWRKIARTDKAGQYGLENQDTQAALNCFPDDFIDAPFALGVQEEYYKEALQWLKDYFEFLAHKNNPKYLWHISPEKRYQDHRRTTYLHDHYNKKMYFKTEEERISYYNSFNDTGCPPECDYFPKEGQMYYNKQKKTYSIIYPSGERPNIVEKKFRCADVHSND